MQSKHFARIFLVCLLPGFLFGSSVEAAGFSVKVTPPRKAHSTSNRPWGNVEPSKPGLNNGVRPDSHYLGAAPGTGWYPTQAAVADVEPVVEVGPIDTRLYEQQNAVYTVRVVSRGNLKTLKPVIPRIEGAILDKIDGPVASTRYSRQSNNLEIINEYHFKLTPLRSGEIVVPPIGFKGTHVDTRSAYGTPATSSGKKFSIKAASPLELQVLPADPAVSPWLPLNDLRLRVHMLDNVPAKEGVPVTLTVELAARGALGRQLPSVEAQLRSDRFRIYRDSVKTTGEVSAGGLELRGGRKETYTIIPLQDGWIQLPPIEVAWWDVDSRAPMLAKYAIETAIDPRMNANGSEASGEFSSTYFWAPLLIFAVLVGTYWLIAWARSRPYLQTLVDKAHNKVSVTGQYLMRFVVLGGQQLARIVTLQKLRVLFALMMPKTVKLWMCARCLENEDSPEAWCVQFRSRICEQLDVSQHAPLTSIVEKIIETQPQTEPARLRSLARSMDKAVYGSGTLDFPAWKKDFKNQLRPGLKHRQRTLLPRTHRKLPALNPHSA